MATNHTTNYNLNLWTPTDKFVREEFNENSTKIDAAIKAVDAKADTKADAAALTAETTARISAVNTLTQTVNTKARIAAGTYTGDGAASRFINTNFTPKAVFVLKSSGEIYSYGSSGGGAIFGGLAVSGRTAGISVTTVQITTGGFNVASSGQAHTNDNSHSYNYIALG